MQRFKKILLIHDASGQGTAAFERAAQLARRNRAELTLVEVIEEIPQDYQMLITTMLPQEIMALAVKHQREQLAQCIAPLVASGIMAKAKVLVGKEFVEIIKEVLRSRHDLVIKTARGKSAVKDILFGSTAMHLMRKCPCPVWVVKPETGPSGNRILAAVDIASPHDAENALSAHIMELATSLARLGQSELHVVHVCDLDPGTFLKSKLAIPPETIAKLSRDAFELRKSRFEAFLKPYALDNKMHQSHLLEGRVSALIPEFADQWGIDLIVMGTLCRTGISGFLMGNTAEKILHRVDCSVLTVKPAGFISPLTLEDDL